MKVRVRGWLEKKPNSYLNLWRVRCNNGTYTEWTTYEDAKRHCDYINNEDSDGEYFEVPDPPRAKTQEELDEEAWRLECQRERERKAEARRKERKRKEEERIANNRKSKRSDDKYVYVISCVQRGYTRTEYYMGDTNLLKMGNSRFTSPNVKKSKVFKTKASAQKMVDVLSKNFLVNYAFRNLKVVRKDKKIFED